jgi:hypothetical protein
MATITEIIRGWNQMGAQLLRVGRISLQRCHLISRRSLLQQWVIPDPGRHPNLSLIPNPLNANSTASAVPSTRINSSFFFLNRKNSLANLELDRFVRVMYVILVQPRHFGSSVRTAVEAPRFACDV